MSFLEGAIISDSIITTIRGDATIFKFDGDGPLHADLKALFVDHLTGLAATTDLSPKLEKHILSQSIRNLPRANATYDGYASKDKKRVTCFENTRQTLRKEIGEWITTILDKSEIYLLSGLAGIGKSTVAQTIAERADNLHLLGASFFFSRDESDRRNAKWFYTSIAFQLCVYDKQFAQAIGKVLIEEKGAAATVKEPMEQLNALIVEPLRHLFNQRSRPLVIVVDALDECDEEDGLIVLQTLEHLVHKLPSLKVVLTSRPQPLLDGFFDNHRVFHMHNIEDKVVNDDIRQYLNFHLSWEQVKSRLRLRTQWSASKEEIEHLVRAAGRLFIIASTAVLFILDKVACNPASQMKKLQTALSQDLTPFDALNEFYTVILRNAVPANCGRDITRRYQVVIGAIVVVQGSLPIGPLANLIGLSSEDIRAVLDNLQSVILLGDNDIPRPYHKSFNDYIQDKTRCKDRDLLIVTRDQHTRFAVCCFDVMSMCLKRNILGLGTPAQYMDNGDGLEAEGISDDQLRDKIAPELRYACVFWANHFERADIEDSNLIKKVDTFAKERLLYWLEALSWICKLESAPCALSTVHKFLKPTADSREILFDAFRLISKSYDVVQRSALHVYHSALPFTPTKTPMSLVYKKDGLRQLGSGPERWDALVAALAYDHPLYRIAFSPDSSRLASWAGREMKLCDAKSGAPVKTFNGDKIALARDFLMVAVYKDNTFTLYDVTSNTPVANYNTASEDVVELALSFDGSRLAAGLSDGTVSLWDSRGIGGSMASLGGYSRKNGRLEFAPSGYHLAYLSDDGGIRLGNGLNGESIASLSCKPEKHVKFAFSHNGSRLAALKTKNDDVYDLTLWNGENGKLIGVQKHVGGKVPQNLLAISDDGTLIATATECVDKGVQLWSGDSLSLFKTLEIGEGIYSLAFSPDVLAIGSFDKVALYDSKTGAIVTSVNFCTPYYLALSPDRLAAVYGGKVHLWDVQSMKASASESTKTPRLVTALTLSPDCLRLASGFGDGTVELWDSGFTEQVTATLKFHSDGITALAFSADGEKIASGSWDGTVRLWGVRDTAPSGILERIFYKPLSSLTFSSPLPAAQTRDKPNCKTLHLVHTFNIGGHSLHGSRLRTRTVRTPDFIRIEKLVFSPHNSRLVALTSIGPKLFDIINNRTISNPSPEEIQHETQLISQPSGFSFGTGVSGEPLLGHFPGHSGGVPILWMPRDVAISAFAARSSKFALGCSDGRLIIGHFPYP